MRYALVYSALVATASAHGLVTSVEGANGVSMPGLSVTDGTPRDCSSNGCGSQADTSIIRDRDMKTTGPLGKTQGSGNVDAAAKIANFMGGSTQAASNAGSKGVGEEDPGEAGAGDAGETGGAGKAGAAGAASKANAAGAAGAGGAGGAGGKGGKAGKAAKAGAASAAGAAGAAGGAGGTRAPGAAGLLGAAALQRRRDARALHARSVLESRQFGLAGLGGLGGPAAGLGGLGGGAGGGAGGGGKKSDLPAEASIADTMGMGTQQGLPTANDQGMVTMIYRQINQDGAGPLEGAIDGTSGGTDPAAFKDAQVKDNVPGAIAGLSTATKTDFKVTVQMPQGMTCDASVGGADNVCIARVRNRTPAGPFGGSGAFTQTQQQRKRALAYRRRRKRALERGEDVDGDGVNFGQDDDDDEEEEDE